MFKLFREDIDKKKGLWIKMDGAGVSFSLNIGLA